MNPTDHSHPNGKAPTVGPLHVAFVLDESGSMEHLAPAVIGGFDEFVSELRSDGADTLFTLTLFDTEFKHIHVATPLAQVPSLGETGYRPGGMTALFDAVAHTVLAMDKQLTADGHGDDKVMVVVMTDGFENSSTDYTSATFAELICTYDERPNWTFVYLGAAHGTLEDAQNAADAMSFKRANAMRWSADDASTRKSMRSLSDATKHRRAAQAMKSEQLFADAGQGEADYRTDEPTSDPQQRQSFTRRNLRDVVDNGRTQKKP